MTTASTGFHQLYATALRQALNGGIVPDYARAAELGVDALAAGLLLEPVLQLHHEIIAEALRSEPAPLVLERAGIFLASYLSPLSKAYKRLAFAYQTLEQERRAFEQLPELLLDGIPGMVYVAPWDGTPGEMLYISPQAETILGFAAPDWIADPQLWLKLIDTRDREQAIADRVQGQVERTDYVSEYRLNNRDGRTVWIHDEARVIQNEAGQPQFWQGVMLEITQRKAAERQAAVAERSRLARELHDSVTQTLIAANMHVRTLAKVWRLDPAATPSHVEQIEKLTQTALAELRVLLLEMQPAELTRVPLPRLLEQLGAAMQNRGSTVFEVAADAIPPLPPDVQLAIYRVAQEALNNIIKHGSAHSGQVRLCVNNDQILLTVSDDGIGFDPAAVPGGHLGLRGMVERAAGIGAQLTVESAPGQATQVKLAWPSRTSAPADLLLPTPGDGK